MVVRVLIHLEPMPDSHESAWWAESPDVAGFSAAAETLNELRILAEHALREITSEDGEVEELEVEWHFAPTEPPAPAVRLTTERLPSGPVNAPTATAERVVQPA